MKTEAFGTLDGTAWRESAINASVELSSGGERGPVSATGAAAGRLLEPHVGPKELESRTARQAATD